MARRRGPHRLWRPASAVARAADVAGGTVHIAVDPDTVYAFGLGAPPIRLRLRERRMANRAQATDPETGGLRPLSALAQERDFAGRMAALEQLPPRRRRIETDRLLREETQFYRDVAPTNRDPPARRRPSDPEAPPTEFERFFDALSDDEALDGVANPACRNVIHDRFRGPGGRLTGHRPSSRATTVTPLAGT